MIEKLKIQSSNIFIIEFVINICELRISICEKFFTEHFLSFFVVTAFANLLHFEFIKIINWFNCKTFLFFTFFKTFQNALSALRFNFVKINFYFFTSNTQFIFELRVFMRIENNFVIFIIFILIFFCFFFLIA